MILSYIIVHTDTSKIGRSLIFWSKQSSFGPGNTRRGTRFICSMQFYKTIRYTQDLNLFQCKHSIKFKYEIPFDESITIFLKGKSAVQIGIFYKFRWLQQSPIQLGPLKIDFEFFSNGNTIFFNKKQEFNSNKFGIFNILLTGIPQVQNAQHFIDIQTIFRFGLRKNETNVDFKSTCSYQKL